MRGAKRLLIPILDHPGGRYLLGKIATCFAQWRSRSDIKIVYVHGLWTHGIGNVFFPDKPRFNYTTSEFQKWEQQEEKYVSQTTDFWLHKYCPREGDVVVEIGAGRGENMLALCRAVGRTGRVLGIEADPTSFRILQSFCLMNGFTNASVLQLAVMDKPGTVRMTQESAWIENSVTSNESSPGIDVRADTIDHICESRGIKDIAFLKMNIEGAERSALLGMQTILPHIRTICVACHDFRADWGHGEQFRTRRFVEQFLTEHGFIISSRREDPRDYVRDHIWGERNHASTEPEP